MKQVWDWYQGLSNRKRTSVVISLSVVGVISTVLSIAGVTIKDFIPDVRWCIVLTILTLVVVWATVYATIGVVYHESVSLTVRKTQVTICVGDLFDFGGVKIIGCDSTFSTAVDGQVIEPGSLHGQLLLKHAYVAEIDSLVRKKAKSMNLECQADGRYDFPLGTVIRYDSSRDNKTYLMLALTRLNENYAAHTNMGEYERTLMDMWWNVCELYNNNPVVLPILGSGVTRFDYAPVDRQTLLRCLLCTLNASGVTLNSGVTVVIHGDAKDIPLYEYKDLFRMLPGRPG